jgi:hypothetical protein
MVMEDEHDGIYEIKGEDTTPEVKPRKACPLDPHVRD